ncbi:hypothetical protein Emed_007507 [Eimeria media]
MSRRASSWTREVSARGHETCQHLDTGRVSTWTRDASTPGHGTRQHLTRDAPAPDTGPVSTWTRDASTPGHGTRQHLDTGRVSTWTRDALAPGHGTRQHLDTGRVSTWTPNALAPGHGSTGTRRYGKTGLLTRGHGPVPRLEWVPREGSAAWRAELASPVYLRLVERCSHGTSECALEDGQPYGQERSPRRAIAQEQHPCGTRTRPPGVVTRCTGQSPQMPCALFRQDNGLPDSERKRSPPDVKAREYESRGSRVVTPTRDPKDALQE